MCGATAPAERPDGGARAADGEGVAISRDVGEAGKATPEDEKAREDVVRIVSRPKITIRWVVRPFGWEEAFGQVESRFIGSRQPGGVVGDEQVLVLETRP